MEALNPSEIRRLWDILPHPPGSWVRWFARAGEQRMGGGCETVEELLWAAASAPKMNFYVAPNPASTRAGTRHSAHQVTHWSWFLVDIDPVGPNASPALVAEHALKIMGKWWRLDFTSQRPVLIHSGRGAQIWIRHEDVLLDDEGRRMARITNGYWLNKLANEIGTMANCRIDTTCMDLPRVMRCPGTLNTKTGEPAIFLVPSQEVFEGLAQQMFESVPPEEFRPVPIVTLPSDTPWQSVFVHLTLRAQKYLSEGKDEPGRHDTMFHVALTLLQKGLCRDEARRALQYGNERWDAQHPGQDPPMTLEPKDIEHALNTAERRLQREQETGTLEVPTQTPQED